MNAGTPPTSGRTGPHPVALSPRAEREAQQGLSLCLTWLDIYAKDVEIMLVTPPGSRSWIKRANDRWAERVNEDSNEIVRKLLGATALYCVRVTLQVGDRILRPIHFIYDCLSFGVIDPDRAVTVKLEVVDGNIGLNVTFGQHFREFMLVRG